MKGLLPRMEARSRKGGGFTYRYHPVGSSKPIPLGHDLEAALRKVLDFTGKADDAGTVRYYWRLYKESHYWTALAERTRRDYEEHWVELDKVFGDEFMRVITEADIARYQRLERKDAPVRANRERSLLSNIFALAMEFGAVTNNPCRGFKAGGVKRNPERPSKVVPIKDELENLLKWLRGSAVQIREKEVSGKRGKQWAVIAAMGEFASKSGSRRCEFLRGTWFQVKQDEARFRRGKQRQGEDIVDVIDLSVEALATLTAVRRSGCEWLFPNSYGVPYTDSGFASMWFKMMIEALEQRIVTRRFAFKDLRAYYTTKFKEQTGEYPEIHLTKETTARIYDRREEKRRRSL